MNTLDEVKTDRYYICNSDNMAILPEIAHELVHISVTRRRSRAVPEEDSISILRLNVTYRIPRRSKNSLSGTST